MKRILFALLNLHHFLDDRLPQIHIVYNVLDLRVEPQRRPAVASANPTHTELANSKILHAVDELLTPVEAMRSILAVAPSGRNFFLLEHFHCLLGRDVSFGDVYHALIIHILRGVQAFFCRPPEKVAPPLWNDASPSPHAQCLMYLKRYHKTFKGSLIRNPP